MNIRVVVYTCYFKYVNKKVLAIMIKILVSQWLEFCRLFTVESVLIWKQNTKTLYRTIFSWLGGRKLVSSILIIFKNIMNDNFVKLDSWFLSNQMYNRLEYTSIQHFSEGIWFTRGPHLRRTFIFRIKNMAVFFY